MWRVKNKELSLNIQKFEWKILHTHTHTHWPKPELGCSQKSGTEHLSFWIFWDQSHSFRAENDKLSFRGKKETRREGGGKKRHVEKIGDDFKEKVEEEKEEEKEKERPKERDRVGIEKWDVENNRADDEKEELEGEKGREKKR